MEKLEYLIVEALSKPIILLVIWAVVMDTVFGCIRAIKEKSFNSCFGINGAIRKVSMLVSIAFLLILDKIVGLNLIGFIPQQVRDSFHLSSVGAAEFFGILYIAYETVSILKNMTLCGLPVKTVWKKLRDWLKNYTSELPDNQDGVATK